MLSVARGALTRAYTSSLSLSQVRVAAGGQPDAGPQRTPYDVGGLSDIKI